ncbi:hypothetical protein SH580_01195 [Coraliomargarita algicola]|uniref:Sialate O-acetylesterase domain-containing protein n=1 Tax=Coraliomargarita algicola TaxID=3092156 RepID=A0ABZ0RJR6_9BACT|nr:hypothetical protein [Coraliomargarita sp. J2-16]WPJ96317.1 hypothetical protein SH580_01195 [Coraliomargarita sp. J2-16]
MKFISIITILGLSAVLPVIAAADESHLFILSGQSNMARLDPQLSFAPTLETAFGADNVTIVKAAWGGQPIRRWYKQLQAQDNYAEQVSDGAERKEPSNGDLYKILMSKLPKAT